MQTTTTPTTAGPASFTLPCPVCRETEARITIDLSDLNGDETFCCRECEEVFSLDFVRKLLKRWAKVVAWIDTAPTFGDDE